MKKSIISYLFLAIGAITLLSAEIIFLTSDYDNFLKKKINNNESGLSEDLLLNASYIYPDGEIKSFHKGKTKVIEEKWTRSWSEISKIAIGDLDSDGKEDAAIVFIDTMDALDGEGTGGSEISIFTVMGGHNELPIGISSSSMMWIGSRKFMDIESVSIEGGFIKVSARTDEPILIIFGLTAKGELVTL